MELLSYPDDVPQTLYSFVSNSCLTSDNRMSYYRLILTSAKENLSKNVPKLSIVQLFSSWSILEFQ